MNWILILGYFDAFIILYTLSIFTIFCVTSVSAGIVLSKRSNDSKAIEKLVEEVPTDALPVSVLVPAYNEELVICQGILSLAKLNYQKFEIIVINDGSSDGTLTKVINEFKLIPMVYYVDGVALVTKSINGVYQGIINGVSLTLINKENGGKADSLNAGINLAKYPLFVAMDADCVVEKDALIYLIQPFLMDKRVIAVGGDIKISNNLVVSDGQVQKVYPPKGFLLVYQIIEYLRVFLVSRVAWNTINTNMIISGAFGMFKKEKVLVVGGYANDTVGEDMELVVRLNLYNTKRKIAYKIEYAPEAFCYTQAPVNLKDFSNQRIRWHVGLMQTLKRHRYALLNPKYHQAGLLGVSYFTFFELISAIIEVVGYVVIIFSVMLGRFNPQIFTILVITILLYSFSVTISALGLQRYIIKEKTSFWSTLKLSLFCLIEPLTYRQWCNLVRIYAMFRYKKYANKWNKVERTNYEVE